MKARPYKLIFILLTTSVLSVLLLQAFWLRNFYLQKKDDFNKTVYAAMEDVARRLDEREGRRNVKQKLLVSREEITNKKGVRMSNVFPNRSYAQVVNRSG